MIFAEVLGNKKICAMASKNSTSSTPTVLIILILIITFPFWIAIGGVIIGLIGGLFGLVFGLLGAILGGVGALIALPFKILFGWGDWSCHWPFAFHGFGKGFIWITLLIIAVLVLNKRNK